MNQIRVWLAHVRGGVGWRALVVNIVLPNWIHTKTGTEDG
jgi:hypothetical protein